MWLDSQKKMLSANTIYAILWDTLFKLPSAYLTGSLTHLKEDNIDSSNRSYYTFLSKWAPEIIINSQPEKFDIKNLSYDYGYLYRLRSQINLLKFSLIGEGFQMSPVYFNKDKTKAFVLTERKQRYMSEIFFEKKFGKWQVIKNEMKGVY